MPLFLLAVVVTLEEEDRWTASRDDGPPLTCLGMSESVWKSWDNYSRSFINALLDS